MQAVGDPENKVVYFAVCGTAEILVPPRWVCGRTVLHIDIYITTTFGSTIRVEDNRNPPNYRVSPNARYGEVTFWQQTGTRGVPADSMPAIRPRSGSKWVDCWSER